MTKARSIITTLFFLQGVFGFAQGEDVIVTVNRETVQQSPSSMSLEALGRGEAPQGRSLAQARLLAERAAKVKAYYNLARTLSRMSLELRDGSSIISETGFIRGAKVIEKVYLPDGGVQVKMVLDVSLVHPCDDEACFSRRMRVYGVPVYVVDDKTEEISQGEWEEIEGSRV
ncbi:MAG: hypothetical protein HYS08_06645 [Chlamydiae bacterium]|nr:hypothetical protein [Chlamydiota bacterium]MBI3267077.1 hypothetical protein [Chlamydiota bacterium]